MTNILLLEDDDILHDIIKEFLEEQNFNIDSFFSGDKALDAIGNKKYDLLLLDINVPEINGLEILEYLRDIKNKTPVIFITSLTNIKYLQKAFELGANDYLKKPFDLDELLIRIKHHLKNLKDCYKFQNIKFFPAQFLIIKNDKKYRLKFKESEILKYFIKNAQKIVTKDELIENIWQNQEKPSDATIRTYIKNLRIILGSESFENIKGVGYKFNLV